MLCSRSAQTLTVEVAIELKISRIKTSRRVASFDTAFALAYTKLSKQLHECHTHTYTAPTTTSTTQQRCGAHTHTMASWLSLRPLSRELHSLACGVPANHTLEDMLEDMQTETAPYAVGHAILMVTATCVLMPLGILLARKKSKWHPVMQTVATLLLIIGWVVIRQSEEEPSEPCPAGSKPAHSYAGAIHGTLGKLLVVAILLQGCLGFAIKLLRRLPALSLVKRLFSVIHRCAAWGVVPAAWLIAIGGLVHFAAMAKPLTAQVQPQL